MLQPRPAAHPAQRPGGPGPAADHRGRGRRRRRAAARRARRVPRLPGQRVQAVLVLHAGRVRAGHAAGARRAVEQQRRLLPGADDQPARRRRPRPGRAGAARHHAAARAPATTTPPPRSPRCSRPCPPTSSATRFPGRMIGTIGQAALNGLGDLAIYIGHTPAAAQQRSPAPSGSPRSTPAPGQAGVHPVLPVRVLRRRARRAAPHAGADQHRHPARRRPARGAVRRAPARRRDAGRHQDRRHGRGRAQRVPRRGARHRHLPAGPAAARRGRAGRDAVLRVGPDADRRPGTSRCSSACRSRRPSPRWSRCAGCRSPRSASPGGPRPSRRRSGGWSRW